MINASAQDNLLENTSEMMNSNEVASKKEAPSAAEFKAAVETVSLKSHNCHEEMKKRTILADEAGFEFKGNTRAKRDAFISEVDEKIKLLYLKLGETPQDQKAQVEAEIRAQEIIKVSLVIEQAFADIAYALTRKELVAELSRKMVDTAKSATISKGQVGNLITEAKALQELFINIEIAAAEAQELINYFELEFKSDAVGVLKNLSDEVELVANLASEPGNLVRDDFVVKFESWRHQLGNKSLDHNLGVLEEVFAKMPDELLLDPSDTAVTTADSSAATGGDSNQVATTAEPNYDNASGWILPNMPGNSYGEVADATNPSGHIVTSEIGQEPAQPNVEAGDLTRQQEIALVIRNVLLGISGRAEAPEVDDAAAQGAFQPANQPITV